MSISSHISELQRKHQNLSDAVETAHRTPSVDPLEVASLKKQKLALKEQIQRLQA